MGLLNNDVKAIYAQCARFYVADLVFYTALVAPQTDIFYQQPDSPDWQLLKSVFTVHYFPDCHKVVRAYCAFFDYIAIANAVTSKQDESQHFITNYLKQGLYGAMYLVNKSKRK